MGGTTEVRNVKIRVQFLTCYLLVLAINSNFFILQTQEKINDI